LMSGAAYSSTERAVGNGDRFLLYTDGLLEATNGANEFFGEERVRESLAGSAVWSTNQWATSLLDGLAKWAGYNARRGQEDDLTVVVVDVQMENGAQTTAAHG
jgi:sigma-B regulation protein RsbU (phosphoserine phosphatase)